jgi:predicted RNA-binding protein with PIN domain
VRLLRDDPNPGQVVVVTSDRWLADRVSALGAAVQSSRGFRDRIAGI